MNSSVPAVRLSCEQCMRRKKKCDKEVPCTACKHAGLTCAMVQRARKPRGKTAQQRGGEIQARVARLEDLVKQLKSQVHSGQEHNAEQGGSHLLKPVGQLLGRDGDDLQGYIASGFWEALSREANGIREILEGADNGDAPSENRFASLGLAQEPYSISRTLLFDHSTSVTEFDMPQRLTEQMTNTLLSIYEHRVDSIVKVLHWPSIVVAIEKKKKLKIEASSECQRTRIDTLECAIHFMALCTTTDAECEQLLYCQRGSLLMQLRIAAESSFSKAKLLEYPDLTVLQAYVIYLTGLRCSTTGASSWTLLPIAVRLASALELGSEGTKRYSPYESEIRRRLWFSIGTLDTQMALDRGSLPLLYCKDFDSPPSTVNDSNLYTTCTLLQSSQTFTDMSFSSMTHRAMMCQKKLYETNVNTKDPWESWNEKIAAIAVFEDYVRDHFSIIKSSATPLEAFTRAVAGGSLANIKLMLRRPLYRIKHDIVPPWDDYDLIKATTDILERSLNKQATIEFSPWAWFAWVKWYALAVLLAELCGSGISQTTDHSYLVARKTFEQYAPMVADSESGMLWKPIVKLMSQVERIRGIAANSNTSPPSMSSHPAGTVTEAVSAIKLDAFEELDPDQTMASPNRNMRCFVDANNNQQMRAEGFSEDGLSWINWDNFLEDMTHSTDMNWGIDWENNDYTTSS